MITENCTISEPGKYLFLDIDGVINSERSNLKYGKQWSDSTQEFKYEVLNYMKEQMELIQESGFRYGKLHLARARSVERFGIGVEGGTKPDSRAMSHLNTLCRDVPSIKMIVSSTWRVDSTVEELKEIFKLWGLQTPERICGKIADGYDRPRETEILEWLSEQGLQLKNLIAEKDIAVLDDMDDMGTLNSCFVKTDHMNGFCADDLNKLLNLYGRG
jgi:hypothetical protein